MCRGNLWREIQIIHNIILNPALDFLVQKMKEREIQNSFRRSLPYLYTYIIYMGLILYILLLSQDINQDSIEDKTSSNKTSASAGSKRNFNAAPTSKLNLFNLSANGNPVKRDWLSKADEILKNSGKKAGESRRQRKKRLWLERKESGIKFGGGTKIRGNKSNVYVGDWAYLPDLVLEMIFQYLDFKVQYHFYIQGMY